MAEAGLLERFALLDTQVSLVHAELHAPVQRGQTTHTQVELKLTPSAPDTAGQPTPVYDVSARLICHGYPKEEVQRLEEEKRLFTLELVLNARYQQVAGTPLAFDDFSQQHAVLSRQLYPLARHIAMPLLSQLGLHDINLPHDLIQSSEEHRGSVH